MGASPQTPVRTSGASPPPAVEVDARLEELRALLVHEFQQFWVSRAAQAVADRRGLDPASRRVVVATGSAGASIRLTLAVVTAGFAGQWSGAPWWRWAVVAAVLGVGDALAMRRHTVANLVPFTRDLTALMARLTSGSDLLLLRATVRRWSAAGMAATVAATIAALLFAVCVLLAPDALRALPVGSTVVLAIILFEVGELTFWSLAAVALVRHESGLDHDLFWPDPVASVEVQAQLRAWSELEVGRGTVVTLYLGLAIVLVGWDSPLVVPLAVGLVATGYLMTLVSTLAMRRGIGRIVARVRDRHLASIQQQLDAYEDRLARLTPTDHDEVQQLLALHDRVRNAPTRPKRSQSAAHAVAALLIPTVMFVLTVLSEVSAERLLEGLLR
jgi:hypothetical protein